MDTDESPSDHCSRKEAVRRILDNMQAKLLAGDLKVSVPDFLRLMQAEREMGDEHPKEIEIRWVNSIRGETSE